VKSFLVVRIAAQARRMRLGPPERPALGCGVCRGPGATGWWPRALNGPSILKSCRFGQYRGAGPEQLKKAFNRPG